MFFSTKKTLVASVATLAVVNAQLGGTCVGGLAGYILPGSDISNCLSLSSLLSVFSSSGSIVAPLDNYLNTLCAATACSNSTLQSVSSSITTSCSSDLGSSNGLVTGLQQVVNLYPTVRAVVCLEDNSTNTRCITETLYAIQNATGTQLSVDGITSLLSGTNTTLLNEIGNLNSTVLCTPCTQAMYKEVAARNASVASGTIGKAINSKCGANFTTGTSSNITSGDASASSSAAVSGSAAASGAASGSSSGGVSLFSSAGTVGAAVAIVVGIVGGGMAVAF
ncbi:hypothetical protein QFC24_002558 [Naganishia onofrii]|uniref:Uncharacterized protein n=1 Tax=Naganishia onofrii TaxID=1851511 RepID=A0ACC2XR31_9TREE|nr:hypothetical protein QFC24_002558 [Naganishia onofrii]